MSRRCTKCRMFKNIKAFSYAKGTIDKISKQCIECKKQERYINERTRAEYNKNFAELCMNIMNGLKHQEAERHISIYWHVKKLNPNFNLSEHNESVKDLMNVRTK